MDKVLTRFGDALCTFFTFFICNLFACGFSTLQWSDLPVRLNLIKMSHGLPVWELYAFISWQIY